MNIMKFWRFLKVFIFTMFGSVLVLLFTFGPSVDAILLEAGIFLAICLSILYFVWDKVHPKQYKVRLIEKIAGNNEFGQRYHAVEINGMILSELSWLPICENRTVEIRDCIPYGNIVTVRLTIKQFDTFARVHIIMCGQPPYVHNHVYS